MFPGLGRALLSRDNAVTMIISRIRAQPGHRQQTAFSSQAQTRQWKLVAVGRQGQAPQGKVLFVLILVSSGHLYFVLPALNSFILMDADF